MTSLQRSCSWLVLAIYLAPNAYAQRPSQTAADAVEAINYYNTGVESEEKGDYLAALGYYEKAIAIDERVYGPLHGPTADLYESAGLVCFKMDSLDRALYYYGKTLSAREKRFGKESLATAASYLDIGSVYSKRKSYDTALDYYAQGLAIAEKQPDPDRRMLGTFYHSMGTAYLEKKDFEHSLTFFIKALPIYETDTPEDQPMIATTHFYIGKSYYQKGLYDAALTHYIASLTIRKRLVGAADLSTKMTYREVGIAHIAKGENEEGLKCLNRSDLANSDAYDRIAIINEYGGQAFGQMRYEGAANLFRFSLQVLEQSNLPETDLKAFIRELTSHHLQVASSAASHTDVAMISVK